MRKKGGREWYECKRCRMVVRMFLMEVYMLAGAADSSSVIAGSRWAYIMCKG